jgi:hypothetical protein
MKTEQKATTRKDARRTFLRKAATVGLATPAAITLLLSAGTKRARATAFSVD